jgi:hypothetical protein
MGDGRTREPNGKQRFYGRMSMMRARLARCAAIVLGSVALAAGCASPPAQGQVAYKSYCLQSRAQNANPVLIYYGYERPRDWEISRGGNWGGGRCGFTEAHELRVVWKTAGGIDREERVDLKDRLPKSIDVRELPGPVFAQKPLVTEPTLRVDVQDKELQVTFEATVRYEGELLPGGDQRLRHAVIKRELYRSSENRARQAMR